MCRPIQASPRATAPGGDQVGSQPSRASAMPSKKGPNQGNTGSRSMLSGTVCEKPIQASQRLSKAGDCTR